MSASAMEGESSGGRTESIIRMLLVPAESEMARVCAAASCRSHEPSRGRETMRRPKLVGQKRLVPCG
jgi:hypothetical protein